MSQTFNDLSETSAANIRRETSRRPSSLPTCTEYFATCDALEFLAVGGQVRVVSDAGKGSFLVRKLGRDNFTAYSYAEETTNSGKADKIVNAIFAD